MKLSTELEEKLHIMSLYKLDAEEYLLIELLLLATDQDAPNTLPLMKYFNECARKTLARDTLQSLKDKTILNKSYDVPEKGQPFVLEDITFDAKFFNNYFKWSYEAGKELFEAYPSYMQTNDGRLYPARNIIKANVESLEAFFYKYSVAIRHSIKKHERALETLKWALDNQLITYGIAEYVLSRKWEEHEKMMEEGKIDKMIVKINTLESV